MVLVKEARHSGYWIYDNRAGQWYTPEEFSVEWEKVYSEGRRGDDNMKRFSVLDPMVGERAMKKNMRDAMAAYLTFRTKLEAYYNFELKPKK